MKVKDALAVIASGVAKCGEVWTYSADVARSFSYIHTCRAARLTLRVIGGLRRESVVMESDLFLFRPCDGGGLASLRFKLTSDVGVRMPERGRDASASGKIEEDMKWDSWIV